MKLLIVLFIAMLCVSTSVSPNRSASNKVEKQMLFKYIDKSIPSVQMYFNTKKYAKIDSNSERVMFRMARLETTYRGPLQYDYNPYRTSIADAFGPWQIILSTGNMVNNRIRRVKDGKITKEDLMFNIPLSTNLASAYLRSEYDNHGSWFLATGVYNSGKIKNWVKETIDYTRYATM